MGEATLQKSPLQLPPATKTLPRKPDTLAQTRYKCMTGSLLRNSEESSLLSQLATPAWNHSWELSLSQKFRIFFMCICRLSFVFLHFSFLYCQFASLFRKSSSHRLFNLRKYSGKASPSHGCCLLMHFSKHLSCFMGFWNIYTLKPTSMDVFIFYFLLLLDQKNNLLLQKSVELIHLIYSFYDFSS